MTAQFFSVNPARGLRRIVLGILAIAGGLTVSVNQTQNAVANGDTRTISLYHSHTQENITITFRRDGSYDKAALDKLNWFLRDWRREEPTQMDPRLFDVVWAAYRESGASETIRVVSAYRSPETNSMLRRRSGAVAKHSQHMLGKAMDFHVPDMSMAKIREIGMRLQAGGVGYYPTAGTPFVHLDVGSVRSWPRMPRQQLERLFPDGKTVHLPADGQPLSGYEVALAEIQSRGGSAISYSDVTSPRRSLWAALFGGEDEEAEVAAPRRGGRAVAARSGSTGRAPQQVAYANVAGGDSSSVYSISTTGSTSPAPETPRIAISPARPKPVEDKPVEAPKPVAVAALTPPPARASSEDEETATPTRLVSTPLPPRRPSDLLTAALSDVPLPPIRPTMVAMLETPVVAEPAKTEIREPAPQLVQMPLPMPRPVEVAALKVETPAPVVDRNALPAAITGSTTRTDTPAQALAFAPSKMPAPPARPAQPSSPKAISAEAIRKDLAPGKYALKMDSASLDTLLKDVASETDKPRQQDKVALPSVRQSMGTVVVAGKFGANNAIAESGKFAGSMVRPMQAGFIRKGE